MYSRAGIGALARSGQAGKLIRTPSKKTVRVVKHDQKKWPNRPFLTMRVMGEECHVVTPRVGVSSGFRAHCVKITESQQLLSARLLAIPKDYPLTFGAVLTGFKTGIADLVVQSQVEGKSFAELDSKRLLVFTSFGLIYQGVFQYFVYVKFMGQLLWPNSARFASKSIIAKLADRKGLRNLFSQVAFDQLLYMPFVWFPSFYLFKECIQGNHEGNVASMTSTALGEARRNFKEDLTTCWQVWVPCNLVNFAFVPLWGRIPFMAGCSFLFCVIVSYTRGGDSEQVNNEHVPLSLEDVEAAKAKLA